MSRARLAKPSHGAAQRAFTLVELMVAITGGLFVSIIVFTIAKNSGRFYQSESRVGEATLGGMVGFDRLRADIARASFLSSPNIQRDPRVCGGPATGAEFPELLENLTNLVITPDATAASNNNALTRDSILLAGSYSSVDFFPLAVFAQAGAGAGPSLHLQPRSLAMSRLGYDPAATPELKAEVLSRVFRANRAVRIADRSNRHYYAVIAGVNTNAADGTPEIMLAASPPIVVPASGEFCSLKNCVGCTVNVVNFIRYDIARLAGSSYGLLYADGGGAPYDDTRTELRRVELDVNGDVVAGTEELIAQYAVDLKFGLLVETATAGVPGLTALDFGSDQLTAFAGSPEDGATPELIRGVRVRLGVRTRDADRETDIDPAAEDLPPGLYRVGLGPNGGAPFARVRTFQADVMLNNMTSISW